MRHAPADKRGNPLDVGCMQREHPHGLTPADQAMVASELERFRKDASMRDPQLPGCLLAFLGMAVLTLTPALGSWMEISRSLGITLFVLAVLALFAGAAVALGGSAAQGRRARREQEAAVGPILAWAGSGGDREAAVRAAARLVAWARWSAGSRQEGPLLDPELLGRLGDQGGSLARSVERHVLSP